MLESECQCEACQQMCRTRPCLPTPDEAIALKARFADRLMTVVIPLIAHKYGPVQDYMDVISPAIKGREGATVNGYERGECTFFNGGLCELHGDCKPLEGRLMRHDIPWQAARSEVVNRWMR